MVKGTADKIFNIIVYILLALVGIVCVFPLMFVVSASITPISEVMKNGGFILIPTKVTFDAYKELFTQPVMPNAFKVTLFVTVVGTIINMILTTLLAYPLSRKDLPGRKFFLLYVVFTMLFNGGLIPTYLVVKSLGITNTVCAMIFPGAVWSFNTLLMKSFFENIPKELFEAARIDGAKELRILVQIVMPLSMPVMMTVGLFYAVGHWNEFFSAIYYITDNNLQPLQVVVRNILMASQNVLENPDVTLPTMTFQMASVVFACLPIIAVYPFIQKYFTQGMTLGAIKG